MADRKNKGERGVILLIVLWVMVALSVMAFGFASNVQLGARTARNGKEGTVGYFLAKAAIQESVFELEKIMNPGTDPQVVIHFKQLRVAQQPVSFELGTGTAQCWIENETGKLDVNTGSADLFRNLLVRQFDLGDAEADVLVREWVDWRKPLADSTGVVHGGPVNAVEDLLALQGMKSEFVYGMWRRNRDGSPEFRRGLLQLATVYSGSAQINLNYAPMEILEALPGVDAAEAKAMVDARSRHYFESIDDCQQRVPIQFNDLARNLVTVGESSTFALVGRGEATGSSASRTVRAIVRLQTNDPMGYRILCWKDEEI